MCCISKIKKDSTFFFAIDRFSKNSIGYHIPKINLGKSKDVTAVLKLNDGVDQTCETFFFVISDVSIELWYVYCIERVN